YRTNVQTWDEEVTATIAGARVRAQRCGRRWVRQEPSWCAASWVATPPMIYLSLMQGLLAGQTETLSVRYNGLKSLCHTAPESPCERSCAKTQVVAKPFHAAAGTTKGAGGEDDCGGEAGALSKGC